MQRWCGVFLVLALAACDAPAGGGGDDLAMLTDGLGAPDLASASGDLASVGPGPGDLGWDPNQILGTFQGSCGTLAGLLHSPDPSLVNDVLVFVAGETYDRASLSSGGQRMYDTPNAGGSSLQSEVMSFEVLHYCFGADLLHTETEVGYTTNTDGGNAITDLEVSIGSDKVGVSVTRAYKPVAGGMTDQEIYDLLVKKLVGIQQSSARVVPSDKWVKQILHVWVATADAEAALARVLPTIDAATRADTIVLVTRSVGGGFLYCDPDPALGSDCPLP